MSEYKIYSWLGNFRGIVCRIAAEFAGINAEFVDTPYPQLQSEEFLKVHSLGKVPVLQCPEGTLFETNAIIKYFARKSTQKLLGNSVLEEAQVHQWMDFVKLDIDKFFIPLVLMVFGHKEFDEKEYRYNKTELFKRLQILNDHFNHNSWLVGDSICAADILLAPVFYMTFNLFADEGYRRGHASLGRYYRLLLGQAPIAKYLRKAFTCSKEWFTVKAEKKAAPAKKEAAPKQKKEAAPKKAEEPKVEKKQGDPLDNLPPSTFNLFDFKTFIVNEQDKVKAVAEFWKQFDPQGYSIWHVKYDKYEGEGIKLYLTSNLKDNTLQRLDKFRKHAYGTFGVYGEEGDYEIEGVWVWRGTEIPAQLKELANFEYHTWTRLDHTVEKDRTLLQEFWTGYECDVAKANGKVARDVTQFK